MTTRAEANGYIGYWSVLFDILILLCLAGFLGYFFVVSRRGNQADTLRLVQIDDLCMAIKYAVIGRHNR